MPIVFCEDVLPIKEDLEMHKMFCPNFIFQILNQSQTKFKFQFRCNNKNIRHAMQGSFYLFIYLFIMLFI
jgi:hypothetical protein